MQETWSQVSFCGPWSSPLAVERHCYLGTREWRNRLSTVQHTKEESLAGAAVDKVLVWGPKNLHDTRQLLLFVFTGEDGETSVQLSKDAAQAPHVDGHVIVHAKDDLRRTVEATLNIRVD